MADPGAGFVSGQYAVDGYGGGGFKFAGMSHRGSILLLPEGVHAWSAMTPAEVDAGSLQPLFDLPKGTIEMLLVGTGENLVPLTPALRARLREAGIRADPMSTGAAARTFNILMAERRRVAAALLAVA